MGKHAARPAAARAGDSAGGLAALGNCSGLTHLALGGNAGLTGAWPDEWGALAALEYLEADGTNISGAGAIRLRARARLRSTSALSGHAPVQGMQVAERQNVPARARAPRAGTLPAAWSGMASVRSIDLHLSRWEPGAAPDEWPEWAGLAQLEYLDLSWGNVVPFSGGRGGGAAAGPGAHLERAGCCCAWAVLAPVSGAPLTHAAAAAPSPAAAPLPAAWPTTWASLRALILAGNAWSGPLEGAWGDNTTSAWPASLGELDLSDNPLGASGGGGGTDIPDGWGGLGLHTLLVRAVGSGCAHCRACASRAFTAHRAQPWLARAHPPRLSAPAAAQHRAQLDGAVAPKGAARRARDAAAGGAAHARPRGQPAAGVGRPR